MSRVYPSKLTQPETINFKTVHAPAVTMVLQLGAIAILAGLQAEGNLRYTTPVAPTLLLPPPPPWLAVAAQLFPPFPLPLRALHTPEPIPPHPKFLVDPSISEGFPAPASPVPPPPPAVAAEHAPPPEPDLNLAVGGA